MSLENDYLVPKFEDFGGVKLPESFKDVKKQIKKFAVQESDIWVTSYPKCGTTWCQELVWLICNNMDYEGAKQDIDVRFPFIEQSTAIAAWRQFTQDHLPSAYSVDNIFPDIIKLLKEKKNVKFIKSHLPWGMLPKEIVEGTKTPKIIHVIRHPKQVVPSYYHHLLNIYPMFIGSLDQFVDVYIKGDVLYGGYFTTVLSYLAQKRLPNLLIISYEEMHSNIKDVIKKIATFLGKSYTEVEVDKLSKHVAFEKMSENTAVNKVNLIQNKSFKFFRKGITDSYKFELNEGMVKKLDQWIKECTEGIDFPYA